MPKKPPRHCLWCQLVLCLVLGVSATALAQPADDPDNDGYVGTDDQCPYSPEDRDGFRDHDGCPDLDNDGDGVCDSWVEFPELYNCIGKDRCPNKREDRDGFEDEDGCPDPDNDKDGIPDVDDECRDKPESKNNYLDHDGCPEPDADRDGVADKMDDCPKIPEDRDGHDDDDGCPEKSLWQSFWARDHRRRFRGHFAFGVGYYPDRDFELSTPMGINVGISVVELELGVDLAATIGDTSVPSIEANWYVGAAVAPFSFGTSGDVTLLEPSIGLRRLRRRGMTQTAWRFGNRFGISFGKGRGRGGVDVVFTRRIAGEPSPFGDSMELIGFIGGQM